MVGYIIISLWNFLFYAAMDIIIYTFVDLIAKTFLKDVQSDEERGQVWLGEAVSLALLCAPIWWISHRPVVLVVLAIITFVYTQLVCRVDFGYWWSQITTSWEEFQSVEQLNESSMMATPAASQKNGPQQLVGPAVYPPSMVYYEGSEELDELPAEPWYPDEEKLSSPSQQNVNHTPPASSSCAFSRAAVTSSNVQAVGSVIQTDKLNLRTSSPSCNLAPVYVPTRPEQQNHIPNDRPSFARSQSEYQVQTFTNKLSQGAPQFSSQNILTKRRAIHSPVRNLKPRQVNNYTTSVTKSRLLSALLPSCFSHAKDGPLGLRNSGQNLCFMNSVLQCIANSPSIAEHLYKDSQTDQRELVLTVAFRDLIKQLSVLPGELTSTVADSWKFRQAASSFNNSVVSHPSGGVQEQQDAAEFLTWLLDTLHTALNSSENQPDRGPAVGTSLPTSYNSMTLTILKFIYGDLHPEKIERLKKTFKQEIEMSNSLAGESSDESIQRLADLEWLTYKQSNNSIINHLFTGQLIEAQRCVACDHISVNIQTFNILPVPIVEPNASGLVYLEDCFDKFATIENLVGSNGLNCARCKRRQQMSYMKREGGAFNNSTLETVMSPIPRFRDKLNDSGFQDNQYRTSTPIRENVTGIPNSSKLTDGQKRSLLRQLPECLVIQLLRFTYEKGQVQKVHRRVSIPLVNLDLSRYTYQEGIASDTETLTYNLYAMCVHTGANNTLCGHYVTYAQACNNTWYKYDDENVVEVNMEYKLKTEEIGENAYLLFYKRN